MKLPFGGKEKDGKKGKMKLRKRHVKKALIIGLYAFVAIVTVIGIVAPALQ
jgi:hypothetical protein